MNTKQKNPSIAVVIRDGIVEAIYSDNPSELHDVEVIDVGGPDFITPDTVEHHKANQIRLNELDQADSGWQTIYC